MRVLYVSAKRGWGGVVTWMYRTAIGLEERGHAAWIISHPASPFTRLAPQGVRLLPMRLGMDFNPATILRIAGIIKRNRIDLVVTNIQKEVIAGGIAARLCGIPNLRILGNHDDVNERIRWRQEHLVDHTVVPSDATLGLARKRLAWLKPEEFSTIYAGRNPVAFSPEEVAATRRAWGVPAEALVVGTTARLTEIKGIDGLITAFEALAREHPAARLVITGEGPDRERLERLAAGLGVSGRTTFAGFSTDPMRTAAAYDIAVLNSTIEGFPYVIVEYMAAGKPVVATRVGGVPEIVADGSNGFLVEPGDRAGLVRALESLAADPRLRSRLGANALDTVARGFSEAIMIERTEQVFGSVITRHAGRRK